MQIPYGKKHKCEIKSLKLLKQCTEEYLYNIKVENKKKNNSQMKNSKCKYVSNKNYCTESKNISQWLVLERHLQITDIK